MKKCSTMWYCATSSLIHLVESDWRNLIAYSDWLLLIDRCVVIGCLSIDSRDTYRSMIVRFASPATRGYLSSFLSLSHLISLRQKQTSGTRVHLTLSLPCSPSLNLKTANNLQLKACLTNWMMSTLEGSWGSTPWAGLYTDPALCWTCKISARCRSWRDFGQWGGKGDSLWWGKPSTK